MITSPEQARRQRAAEEESAYQQASEEKAALALLAERLRLSTPQISPEVAAFAARITWLYGWRPAESSALYFMQEAGYYQVPESTLKL
jgi:hypothetical protein